MNFTGEQYVPGNTKPRLIAEHETRYAHASKFSAGQNVLDIACGTGYGTAELAKNALSVKGVDISEESIAHAKEHYSGHNTEFINASDTDDLFADGTFDLICSFETIEHLDETERKAYLNNLNRWLKPNGTLLLSTPNKKITTPFQTKPLNPYHVLEFTLDALLKELTDANFEIRQVYGQRIIRKIFSYYIVRKMIHLSQRILRRNFHIYEIGNGPEIQIYDRKKFEPRIFFVHCIKKI